MIFITRIPVCYNDGTRVPKEVLQEIADEVFQLFGGCTMESPGTGVWAAEEGKVYSEESFRLEVACDRNQYAEAREMVLSIGKRLRQKAMYFEIRYFDGVEILDVPPQRGTRQRNERNRGERKAGSTHSFRQLFSAQFEKS